MTHGLRCKSTKAGRTFCGFTESKNRVPGETPGEGDSTPLRGVKVSTREHREGAGRKQGWCEQKPNISKQLLVSVLQHPGAGAAKDEAGEVASYSHGGPCRPKKEARPHVERGRAGEEFSSCVIKAAFHLLSSSADSYQTAKSSMQPRWDPTQLTTDQVDAG